MYLDNVLRCPCPRHMLVVCAAEERMRNMPEFVKEGLELR